jgi:hypothetical protein
VDVNMSTSGNGRRANNNWPLASHFSAVLQNPKIAFKDAALKQLTIERDASNQPKPRAGNFATVFRGFHANGEAVAVRVFTKPSDERRERYQKIYDYLRARQVGALIGFQYAEEGIRSAGDGKFYPLVTMDWVSGDILFTWAQEKCRSGNGAAVDRIADQWVQAVQDLQRNQIAHGDLQHANVMIDDAGQIKLVDYDCMCVPELVGRKNLELGVCPYQHPERNETTLLSLDLDNYSALFIFVALRALGAAPDLWRKYIDTPNYDKLLFAPTDFDEPAQSPLLRELSRSPKEEVRRLSAELVELRRVEMDRVPRLGHFLFSFDQVKSLLDQRDFDGAIEMLTRNNKPINDPDAKPPLPSRLADAQQRIKQRQDLERAVNAGDEAAMQQLYVPKLLDDYPKAAPLVAIAKLAPQVVPLLGQLDAAQRGQKWRQLVQVWDQHQGVLRDRKSAQRFAGDVQLWRPRNQAADAVLAQLQQSAPSVRALRDAWDKLQRAGGHPDADGQRPRVERLLEQERAWSSFAAALAQPPGESPDRALLAAWREDLFKGWSQAEAERPRLREAEARLRMVADVRAAAVQAPSPAAERDLIQKAAALPNGYQHADAPRVQQARDRLDALARLEQSLSEPASDAAILSAVARVVKAQAKELVPPDWLPRIGVAQQRGPILKVLRDIPHDYPPSQGPEFDARLVDAWKEKVLRDCRDADPWRPAFAVAKQRLEAIDALREAISAGDQMRIVDLCASSMLQGYPLDDDWVAASGRARKNVEACRRLVSAIKKNDGEEFVRAFDARVVRENPSTFQLLQPRLLELAKRHLRDARHLRLQPLLGMPWLSRGYQGGSSFRVVWNWPELRFTDQCVLTITRKKPTESDNLSDVRGACFQRAIDFKTYEGYGALTVPDEPGWYDAYVSVWAKIDLGFAQVSSAPFVLGRFGETHRKGRAG